MAKNIEIYRMGSWNLEISTAYGGMTDVTVECLSDGVWGTWGSVQDGILYTTHDEERRCPRWLADWVEETVGDYEDRHIM